MARGAFGSRHRRPDSGRPAGARPTSGPPAWARSIASLASAIRHRVLRPRHVAGGPAVEPGQRLARRRPERDELGVLDPPAAGELLDDQLRVEQQVDLAGAQLPGQVERPHDARCTRPRCWSGRRGSRRSRRPGRARWSRASRPPQVEERRAERGRARVAARRAVRADDEAGRRRPSAPAPRRPRPACHQAASSRTERDRSNRGSRRATCPGRGPGRTGSSTRPLDDSSPPRSKRQAIWSGS